MNGKAAETLRHRTSGPDSHEIAGLLGAKFCRAPPASCEIVLGSCGDVHIFTGKWLVAVSAASFLIFVLITSYHPEMG
jgi:hypothetical protein